MMNRPIFTQQQQPAKTSTTFLGNRGVLQRQCATCGNHAMAGGECSECSKKKKWKGLQAKLTIGEPDDAYEREADRVVDQVMAMQTPVAPRSSPLQIQRFTGHLGGAGMDAPPSVERVLASPGRPLEPAIRAGMEQRFGHDFSGVRVHTDAAAAASSREVAASAYTVGQNIVFGSGQFSPFTTEGQRLLTHEMVHVIQQSHSSTNALQRQTTDNVHSSTTRPPSLEKSSVSVEAAYRRAGLLAEAEAVRNCRELGVCNKILTETEAEDLYARGRVLAGLPPPEQTGLGVSAMAGVALQSPLRTPPSLPPSTLFQTGVGLGEAATATAGGGAATSTAVGTGTAALATGTEAATATATLATGAEATAATGTGAAVGTVALPITAGVLLVLMVYSLYQRGRFQAELRRQGYIILPNVLGVCIGNCHQPSRSSDTPTVDQPWNRFPQPTQPDTKLLERWIRATPQTSSQTRPQTIPRTGEEEGQRRRCPFPTGLTQLDPIPIQWHKQLGFYPSHIMLRGIRYERDNPTYLPNRYPIGVKAGYWPSIGKVLQLIPEERNPTVVADFREELSNHGFDWGHSRYFQADHVQDLQWASPDSRILDHPNNLWPCDGTANLSAGSTQNIHQRVSFCESVTGPAHTNVPIQSLKRRGGWGRFFQILYIGFPQ